MRLERIRPTVLRMTVHSYELATIAATLRWMVETEPEDVPTESLQMVRKLLADYERELAQLDHPSATLPQSNSSSGDPPQQ
jgi:hypothetical protein